MLDLFETPTPRRGGGKPPASRAELSCSSCDGRLVWHQPDPGRPDRLLGTCSECGEWCVFETAPDGDGVLIPIRIGERDRHHPRAWRPPDDPAGT